MVKCGSPGKGLTLCATVLSKALPRFLLAILTTWSSWTLSGTSAARPNNIQFQHQRPRQDDAKAFAQQGGWVLTREQLVRVKATCKGFLPPFPAHWIKDNVEFYSGGFQLFNQHHCGLQRILSLSSAHYGNHLLHHVGQNKHRTLTTTRLVPQDTMLEVMQDAAYQAWTKWSPISVIERPPALFD